MVRQILMCVLISASMAGVASAQVAMLTQVGGEVTVSVKAGAPRPAVAFLKLNEGETLKLAATARVQMVYLASGRQEVWKGAGAVEIGSQESKSTTLKAETSQVPTLILKQLQKTPAVGQGGKTGMVMLRSLDNLAELDQLEKDYKEFRAKAAADDTTPEVFYLTGLLELQDYERATTFLEELKTKQRTQPALEPVIAHFSTLLAAAKKPRG
ncbi:MAG TPA: hypothetical protein VF491_10455 [Vicinamibacterales bacterium]|jgi:hypothetical protein